MDGLNVTMVTMVTNKVQIGDEVKRLMEEIEKDVDPSLNKN